MWVAIAREGILISGFLQRRYSSTSSAKWPLSSEIKFWSATSYERSPRYVASWLLTRNRGLQAAQLQVMGLAYPAISTRDTALFMSFRRTLGYRPNDVVPLATLVKQFMGRDIEQNGDIPVSIGAGVKEAGCTVGADQVWSRWSGRGQPWTSSVRASTSGRRSLRLAHGRVLCHRSSFDDASHSGRLPCLLPIGPGELRIPRRLTTHDGRRDRRKMYECHHGLCYTCTAPPRGRASLTSCNS